VLLAMENLGIDVTAMIAGLGVGGIAVALAVQNILGDLFGSLSIVLDKPFVVGDFIIVGDKLGTVEKIGLKTTRLRALSGEQLIFSNMDLLSSRIQNFKRMSERRVLFSFGVEHSTPIEQVQRIPGIIREAIESQERTRFDRAHFFKFGESSLDFEAVYFMLVPDYNSFMDVQQKVNFELLRRLKADGVVFAQPVRKLHLMSVPEVGAGRDRVAPAAT
jgi:small-conductance mechanosensitive channel